MVNKESGRNEPINDLVNDPIKRTFKVPKLIINDNRTRQHPVRTAGGSLFISNLRQYGYKSTFLQIRKMKLFEVDCKNYLLNI